MEFKGTKGKWTVANYGHCLAIETELREGDKHTVFTDQFCHASRFDGDAKANALLISKAPEMLEMLEKTVEFFDEGDSTYSSVSQFIDQIKQLIKSATEI